MQARASSCVVPKRIHLSALLFTYSDDLTSVEKRLQHEPFDAVGKSLPDNFARDVGWFTPDQLTGTQYAAAASLAEGGTARIVSDIVPGFVHVEEIRQQMTCDQAIAANPHDQWPRLMRAGFEVRSRRYADAIADYNAAIGTDRQMTQTARYGLAGIYYSQRKYKKALDNIDEAMTSNRGDVYTLRALIEEAMGDDDLATADAAQGDTPAATYALALAYSDLGYFAASNEQLAMVLKHNPASGDSLAARGFNEFSSGDVTAARADLLAASSSNPQMEQPYIGLAMINFIEGNAPAARRFARRALAVSPQDQYAALWVLISDRGAKVDVHTSKAWPGPVIDVFRNRVSVDSLGTAAASSDPLTQRLQQCEAHFYSGVYWLQRGNKSRALPMLQAAAGTCPYREYERPAAAQLLIAMKRR